MMSTPTTPRRWYHFSIASLLWLMLVVALLVAGFREHRQRVSLEADVAALAAKIERLDTQYGNSFRKTTVTTKQMQTSGEIRP
jgi:hypothetical protein